MRGEERFSAPVSSRCRRWALALWHLDFLRLKPIFSALSFAGLKSNSLLKEGAPTQRPNR
jgi:hypothetical protein